MVHQEIILFDGTVRDNLLIVKPGASEDEILQACDRAFIGDFIRSLPEGLDTKLGTDGLDFSGGQRQRIAIARIFLKNPKILIFDEAMSALDHEAEQEITGAWKELAMGRTSIVIAHRLSTILEADRVAVLDEGKLVSCAHHTELLKSCPVYRSLFSEQYSIASEVAS